MQKQKTNKLAIALTAVALALTLGIVSSYAMQGEDPNTTNENLRLKFNQDHDSFKNHFKGKGMKKRSPEHMQAMQEVINNKDYNTFSELVKDKPIAEKITQENFDKFIQMHELMKQGDFEEAKKIHEELGIPFKGIKKKRMRLKDHNGDGYCDFQDRQN